MKQKLFRLVGWSALLSGASVLLAGEMAKAALPSPPVLATSASGLDQSLFCPIINIMFGVLIFVAVIMVMWAAYTYLTAGDDTEKVHRATKTLTYAAVAIVVAILAEGFPALVGSVLGQSGGGWVSCIGSSSSPSSPSSPSAPYGPSSD